MADENDGKPPEKKDEPAKEPDSKEEAAVDSGWGDEGAKTGAKADAKSDEPKADDAKADVAKADDAKADDAKADDAKAKADDAKPDATETDDVKPDAAKATGEDTKSDEPEAESKDDVKKASEDEDEDDDDEAPAKKKDDESEKEVAQAADDDPGKSPTAEKSEKPPERKAQAWGRPLARLDKAWTTWEVWLCAIAVVLEVLVLTMWVGLKGLSTEVDGSSKAGIVFRAITGAVVLGVVANQILKRKSEVLGRVGAIGGMLVGAFLAKYWGNFAIDWSGNLLNWYQQASFLTLWGGLRGVGTRLTLLLALLGGSLATAAGKHITIDLATRYMKPKLRLPVVVSGWIASSIICGTAAWGFFDHIAIDDFGAKAEMRGGEKLSHVASGLSEDFFVARKQIGLDFKSLPHVLKGERYSEWMSAAEWNAWVESAGFVERYGKEQTELLKVGDDVNRAPIVLIPDKGEPRGELAKAGNLVFPFGLFIISLRFILLALLALSGHKNIDPEAAHELGIGGFKKTDDEPEGGEAR